MLIYYRSKNLLLIKRFKNNFSKIIRIFNIINPKHIKITMDIINMKNIKNISGMINLTI